MVFCVAWKVADPIPHEASIYFHGELRGAVVKWPVLRTPLIFSYKQRARVSAWNSVLDAFHPAQKTNDMDHAPFQVESF